MALNKQHMAGEIMLLAENFERIIHGNMVNPRTVSIVAEYVNIHLKRCKRKHVSQFIMDDRRNEERSGRFERKTIRLEISPQNSLDWIRLFRWLECRI